jgi:predicted GNAT family acetyltransferase
MTHILDQPAWNGLVSGNNNLSFGIDSVKFFDSSVSPFADLRNQDEQHFNILYNLIDSQQVIVPSVKENLNVGHWTTVASVQGYQMVYGGALQEITSEELIQPLEESNITEMLSLTERTEPGPFAKNTIDFGHYHGIFQNNELASMAGQRLHPGKFAEISAVCTEPKFTGKGFAKKLILHQINRIVKNNEVPFLHVKSENTGAIKLYESLGFQIRTTIFFHVLRK